MSDPSRRAAVGLMNRAARMSREAWELSEREVRAKVSSGELDATAPGIVRVSLPPKAVDLLNKARQLYVGALDLLSPDDHSSRAAIHHQLGGVDSMLGHYTSASNNFLEAIRLHEAEESDFLAAQSHSDLAKHLAQHRADHNSALQHAEAALALYARSDRGAEEDIDRLGRLIETLSRPQSGPSATNFS